jgi:plastocyanin
MNKSTKTIVGIIALVVIIGAAIIIFKPSKTNAPSGKDNSSNATNNSSSAGTTTDNTAPAAVTITYNGSSFSLSGTSIKSGESVKVINSSSKGLDFYSDPHPVHTDDPELNAGDIASGQSKTFKLTTKGTWGFHNHLNASQNGKITVE